MILEMATEELPGNLNRFTKIGNQNVFGYYDTLFEINEKIVKVLEPGNIIKKSLI